jgi:PAS domain S-box-containing protein
MLELLQRFFAESPFIPHGHCYLWKPGLVWLHIVSDGLIALAYYSIPITLLYFVQKRKDLPFDWIFVLFGVFIVSCGTTHVMEVWTLWHPTYWLAGFLKAFTAVVSMYTAITLVPIIPLALALPSPAELEAANRKLEAEIIERSRIEEELRSSQEMLWQVMDNIPQFIYWKDKHSVYLGCNHSFARLTGLNSPTEIIGKTDSDLPWTAEQTAFVRERDVRVMETNTPETYLMETRQQADGKQVWMNTTKIPLHNSNGEVMGILGSAEDVTERKLAENALRESEERWHLVLQGNNDGIWDWNITTNQTFRSPGFHEILGYEDGELGSSNDEWVARIHPDDFDRVRTANQDYLSRKAPYYAVEYRLRCKNGDYKWVLSRGQAEWDEEGNPVRMVGSMSDITERKHIETALYQLNVELEERVKERTVELEAANQLLQGQTQVLEMLAKGASLSEMLEVLIRTVEGLSSQTDCSIVLFPKPRRINSQDIALSGGLRTCFSEPIFSSKGEILGTVTVSYRKPRRSRTKDVQLRQTAAYVAGITIEHKRVEEERSRLIAIFEASTDYIGTADPEGNSLWYNSQLKTVLGLDLDADIGKRLISENHPQWAVEIVENQGIPTAIRDGIWVGETALRCHDGVEIPVSQMIIAHKSFDGEVEYFSTIMRDISERKRAELTLRESEERFRVTFEQAAVGIAHVNLEGRFLRLNQKFRHIVGYSHEEMLGYTFQEITYPEDLEADLNYVRQLLAGEIDTYSMEKRYLRKDSSLVWINLTVSLRRYPDGEPRYFIAAVVDISARKQAETALQESYNLLHSIINATPDSIFVKNLQHRYLLSNSVRASLFNKSVEEIFGKDDSFLFPPDLCGKIQADDRRIMTSGNTETVEEVFVVQGEERTYLTTKSVYRNAERKIQGLVGFAKDITPLKQAEQKLKALNADLARSNQELEQFAYVASHDLREPLRKIKSYTDLLAKRYKGQLDEKADKYIAYVTDGAERMQALITDLLAYSRVSKGELTKEPTDLKAVLELTLSDLSHAIEESNTVITTDPLPTVNANSRQLGQLFQNLIANGIKFRGEKQPQIQIKAALNSKFWTISVQDNGIGIEPQFAERIFIIFQRLHTKDEYEGTGIGLAICKKIVERHGGQIWLESELGRGTTFFFTLPAF